MFAVCVTFRLAVLKYNYHFAKKSPKVQQSTAQILCQVGTYYNDKCRWLYINIIQATFQPNFLFATPTVKEFLTKTNSTIQIQEQKTITEISNLQTIFQIPQFEISSYVRLTFSNSC